MLISRHLQVFLQQAKIGLINKKREGYITLNRFGAGNLTLPKQEKAFFSY